MRALITLCAAALLFAAGCSKTNDTADNPMPPADQTGPAPMPPADRRAMRLARAATSGSVD
jgi:hypothetical protein